VSRRQTGWRVWDIKEDERGLVLQPEFPSAATHYVDAATGDNGETSRVR
jgi:hypothetical protein